VLTRVSSGLELARFAREAQIASSVDDPNVVGILDVDVASTGYLFLVMELVRGVPLSKRKERFGDLLWALPVLRNVARGLAAIHAKGVVHRDLKPGNVLLEEDADHAPIVKISDFGISTVVEESDVATMRLDASEEPDLTVTGAIMGTPVYMAPEAAHGAKTISAAADVFSLGVLAFELCTGERPYTEPPAVSAMKNAPMPAPPAPLASRAPGLDARVATVLDRALSLSPEARPAAQEIADVLTAALASKPKGSVA
jgi:serine/threonine-protein kinase